MRYANFCSLNYFRTHIEVMRDENYHNQGYVIMPMCGLWFCGLLPWQI